MGTRDDAIAAGQQPVTRSQLVAGLRALGVVAGDTVMVHARLSALGWVVGGSGTVVEALLAAVGPDGTIMAYAGWNDDTYDLAALPPEWQQAIRAETPPFDPRTAEGAKENGALPERIRTWPGAQRSRQPEASIVALGSAAAWLTADHPWNEPYGAGSPLARLVTSRGKVLMLGAPLDTITLLHHAETLARVANKRRVRYELPISDADGGVTWRVIEDINTSSGAFDYAGAAAAWEGVPGRRDNEAEFAAIARLALSAGIGRAGQVGRSTSYLFPAPELLAHAVAWMERTFGGAA